MENCNAQNGDDDSATVGVSRVRVQPPLPSHTVPSIEEIPKEKEDAMLILEEAEKGREPTPSQRAGIEVADFILKKGSPLHELQHEDLPPLRNLAAMNSDSPAGINNARQTVGQTRQVPYTTKYFSRDNYIGSEIEFSESSDGELQPHEEEMDESVSMNLQRNVITSSILPGSHSRRRGHSCSPVRHAVAGLRSSQNDVEEFYEYSSDYRLQKVARSQNGNEAETVSQHPEKTSYEYRDCKDLYSRGRGSRRRYESSSPESSRRHKRRHSRERGCTYHQRSKASYSSMSPPRKSVASRNNMTTEWSDLAPVKSGDIVESSATSDRKRRRRQQALLDADKSRREKNGRKPFYLILDHEGRPYGTGKPAWIAEINKLAIGLDPSCTNIRKQTFQDVQTLRNRLDDNFEYSGTLNEDYLRALMGRAVTKRRSELISLIKRDGPQPEYIDEQVWRRLEKLATSKQREDKVEQGRHANACRKTLGRTGCRGVDGVREKLRSLLDRSPDPSEVEEEMHRDKGYGGQRRKKHIFQIKEEKNSTEVSLHDDAEPSQRSRTKSHDFRTNAGYVEPRERQLVIINESRRQGERSSRQRKDEVPGMIGTTQRRFPVTKTMNNSKEEYIKQLEAEINLLRKGNANELSSNDDMPSPSAAFTRNG